MGVARDLATDVVTAPRRLALMRAAERQAPRRVLAISVARPERAGSAAAAAYELERSHVHAVDVRLAAPRPGATKWESLNALLAHTPADGYDWLLVYDDDVILSRGFLDGFLLLSDRFGLELAAPAHKHWSHGVPRVLRRRALGVVRRVAPIGDGPVTALRRSAFPALLPFGPRGLDGAADGRPQGIVDATPIRRVRPAGPR